MAASRAVVRVSGLRETIRALNAASALTAREVREAMREVAEPVRATGADLIGAYAGASTGTIGTRSSMTGAAVTQRARKVTGLRPDFGALQQRRLEDALDQHQDEVEPAVEKALDRIALATGF